MTTETCDLPEFQGLENVKTSDLIKIQKSEAFTEADLVCQAVVTEELARRQGHKAEGIPGRLGTTVKEGLVAVGEMLPATLLGLGILGFGAYHVYKRI